MYFEGSIYLYFALFIVPLFVAGWLAWRWLKLPGEGAQVYDANVRDGLLSPAVPKAEFVRAYVRAERPVMGACLTGAGFLALLLLPVTISVFTDRLNAFNAMETLKLSFRGRSLEGIAGDFVGFVLIFVMNFVLVLGAIALSYRLRAPSLRSEIRRLEETHR